MWPAHPSSGELSYDRYRSSAIVVSRLSAHRFGEFHFGNATDSADTFSMRRYLRFYFAHFSVRLRPPWSSARDPVVVSVREQA